jgi:hypothetical protein
LNDLRKPGDITRLIFWNLIIRSFDKGKPVERRGRKAKGLKPYTSDGHDSLAAESDTRSLVILSAFIEEEKSNGTQK